MGSRKVFQNGFKRFQTLLGALTGCALFPAKKLNLNTAILEIKSS
jgi:hypothetical protein